jgi:hypothetical protein
MEDERKIWEQQQDEPDLWYGRFRVFLRLGTKRNVNAVYTKETKRNLEQTRTNAHQDWYEAEKTWKWKERARAWDRDQDKVRAEKEEKQRDEDLKVVREMLLNHVKADVDKSSTSQIQAAKLLIEHYATSGEIDRLKEGMQTIQETLKSLGADL